MLRRVDFSHDTKSLVQYFRSLGRRWSQVPTGILTQMSFPVNLTQRPRPSSSTLPTILLGRYICISHEKCKHFLTWQDRENKCFQYSLSSPCRFSPETSCRWSQTSASNTTLCASVMRSTSGSSTEDTNISKLVCFQISVPVRSR